MSLQRNFTGFEIGEGGDLSNLSAGSGGIFGDKLNARSGDFYFSDYRPAGSGGNTRASYTLSPALDAPNNGDEVRGWMQVAIRFRQLPVAGTDQVCGFFTGSEGGVVAVRAVVTSAGVLAVNVEGTVVSTGFTPVVGTWYVLRLTTRWQRNNAGNDPITATLQVYDGASIDTIPTLLASATSAPALALLAFRCGTPTLGSAVATSARILDFDDWWWIAADTTDVNSPLFAWPGGSRIAPVVVTAQGASAQWTGSYQLVQDIPNSAAAGNEQAVTATGQRTTFTHDSAFALGLIPGFTGGGSLPYQLERSALLAAPTLQVFLLPGGGVMQHPVWVFVTQVADDGTGTKESPPSEKFLVEMSTLPAIYLGIDSTTFGTYGGVFRCYITNAYSPTGIFDPITNANGLCATLDRQPFLAKFQDTTTPWMTAPGLVPTPGVPLPAYLGVWVDTASQGTLFYPYQDDVAGESTALAEALKVYAWVKRPAGTATINLVLGADVTNVPATNAYTCRTATRWTPATEAEFDALEFGAETTDASTANLGAILMEVITGGRLDDCSNLFGQYQQQAGVFVSNGAFQSIALPFQPTVVLIKRIGATASAGCFKAWWMGGTQSWLINSTSPSSIAIMSLDTDGFTVGPDQAANGTGGGAATYAYVAIKDGQQDVNNGAYMVSGNYIVGSAAPASTVIDIPYPSSLVSSWTPSVVLLLGNASTVLRTTDMPAGQSLPFTAAALSATAITAVGNGTFTVGNDAVVTNTGMHPYVAFRFDAGGLLATVFQTGSFLGTGGVQVIPTAFSAELIVLDHVSGAYTGRFRSASGNVGNNSVPWPGGAVTTTDITAIGAADFTVGAGASVAAVTSYWIAWKGAGAFGDGGSGPEPPPDDCVRGSGVACDPPDDRNPGDPLCPTPVVPSPV